MNPSLESVSPRERIVAQATRVFFSLGFHRVSMDQLAEDLGMSKKTLYVHFSSKRDLLRAVLEGQVARVEAGLRPIIESSAPFPKKFKQLAHEMHQLTDKIRPVFLEDLRRFAPECFGIVEEFRSRALPQFFGRLLDDGVREKLLDPAVPREVLIRVMLHSIQGILRPEVMGELRMHPAEALDHILSIVLRGILTPAGRKKLS